MEQKIWAKSILNIYRYLERAIEHINQAVTSLSLNPYGTCTDTVNKIMALTERKVWLINLKLVVEDNLSQCTPTTIKFLGMKYINGMSITNIAKTIDKCERTVIRALNKAVDNFCSKLIKNEFDVTFFVKHYSTEKWIMNEYEKIAEYEAINLEKSYSLKRKNKE